MRSTTTSLMRSGGCLRARDWLCKTASSSGGASRKRLTHFLTQPCDMPTAWAYCLRVQAGCWVSKRRKFARAAEYTASMRGLSLVGEQYLTRSVPFSSLLCLRCRETLGVTMSVTHTRLHHL